MADLKRSEIRTIGETVAFPNGYGYVLDLSDRTIAEFFEDEFSIDIDNPEISGEGSKRIRLIKLLENSDSFTAAKILRVLWDRREGLVMRQGAHLDANSEKATQSAFLKIIQRLDGETGTPSTDGIEKFEQNRTLEELIADIERSLRANKPEVAMDHLHTYCMKKFAHLLSVRDISCSKEEPLHSRMGKYRNALSAELTLTEFTDRSLKMTISLFESFNGIRNDRSLAHDNLILEPEEARYIFETVCNALRFIRSIEAGRYKG